MGRNKEDLLKQIEELQLRLSSVSGAETSVYTRVDGVFLDIAHADSLAHKDRKYFKL
jgi:hypothetical protein